MSKYFEIFKYMSMYICIYDSMYNVYLSQRCRESCTFEGIIKYGIYMYQ